LTKRFGWSIEKPPPVWLEDGLRREDAPFTTILFTDDTPLGNLAFETDVYAQQLRARRTEGRDGVNWWWLLWGRDRIPRGEGEAALRELARYLSTVYRLPGFPRLLSLRAINNLAALLLADMEYFLFPIEAGVKGSATSVMAVPIDPSMDAYFIELDHPVPRFIDPQSMEDRVSLNEAYYRGALETTIQNYLHVRPMLITLAKEGESLADRAAECDYYRQSRKISVDLKRRRIESASEAGEGPGSTLSSSSSATETSSSSSSLTFGLSSSASSSSSSSADEDFQIGGGKEWLRGPIPTPPRLFLPGILNHSQLQKEYDRLWGKDQEEETEELRYMEMQMAEMEGMDDQDLQEDEPKGRIPLETRNQGKKKE
jgi:hypothetical protein